MFLNCGSGPRARAPAAAACSAAKVISAILAAGGAPADARDLTLSETLHGAQPAPIFHDFSIFGRTWCGLGRKVTKSANQSQKILARHVFINRQH